MKIKKLNGKNWLWVATTILVISGAVFGFLRNRFNDCVANAPAVVELKANVDTLKVGWKIINERQEMIRQNIGEIKDNQKVMSEDIKKILIRLPK